MTGSLRNTIRSLLRAAIQDAISCGEIKTGEIPPISLEIPGREDHGDIASNISFLMSKDAGISSKEFGNIILRHLLKRLGGERFIGKVETAGGGFLNFFLKQEAFYPVLLEILKSDSEYGNSDIGRGKKVLIEFVSANPTGPLHVGHARNAVVGDVLSNIFSSCGYRVSKEYYLNDVGSQVDSMGESLRQRCLQLSGKVGDVEVKYKGEYVLRLARELLESHKESETFDSNFFRDFAVRRITEEIRKTLEDFGIFFDSWFCEKSLHSSGDVKRVIGVLDEGGFIEKKDGALWFKSSLLKDEKDRVIIKNDGSPTYLASDIAYHHRKLNDGYDMLINVWGADHHGYVPRLKGSLQALGFSPEKLRIVLIQLVKLKRGGRPVTMSTREGEFLTLRELMDEVGKDGVRFFMLMRRSDAQLDFDLELAKRQSPENPVYYVQYAHARICSLLSFADEKGLKLKKPERVYFGALREKEELNLIKVLGFFPEVIEGSARSLEPHRLTGYLQGLASAFHNFYDRLRVVGEDEGKADARLLLVEATRIVLARGLSLLGISAPEKM